jgi:CheY-like chemotaxis protein
MLPLLTKLSARINFAAMTKTILLLDDDADEQFILQEAFTALGMNVDLRQFSSFPDLLTYLDQATVLPEMLLLDVNLPRFTGIEAIGLLKSQPRLAELPIVMYSNAADDNTINACFQAGAGAYMKKTNSMKMLMKNLRILMAWNIHTLFNLPLTERTLLN